MSDLMLQVIWINPQQAHASLNQQVVPWAKSMLMAGHRLVGEFRLAEDAKTDGQRSYYHGVVLKEIAKQATVNGQRFPLPVWKEHFRNEYLGFKTVTYVNPMTGKKSRRRVRKSTEDLGVKAYAALIEKVTAFAVTDLGVEFPARIDPETGEIFNH
jgi:hypothetical protein